jgi:hypothetical protein
MATASSSSLRFEFYMSNQLGRNTSSFRLLLSKRPSLSVRSSNGLKFKFSEEFYGGLRVRSQLNSVKTETAQTSNEKERDERTINEQCNNSRLSAWQSVAKERWEGELAVDGYVPL